MTAEPIKLMAATDPRIARLLERMNKLPRPEARTAEQEAAYQYLGDLVVLEAARDSMPVAEYRSKRHGLVLALAHLAVKE